MYKQKAACCNAFDLLTPMWGTKTPLVSKNNKKKKKKIGVFIQKKNLVLPALSVL